jgi:serine/threonine-protein kinase
MDDRGDETELATIDGRPTAAGGDPTARESVRRVSTDRYRVINRLGKGGMGEVMLVRDSNIGRDVALKRIRKADPSDRLVARFLREASIQGRLEHPAIVPVHDIGRDKLGMPFFTMKKLTGTTLAKILDDDQHRAAFPRQRLLRAFTEVCLAIELAHTRGVVHRDLKPENIMLGDFGEVYVLDWGVAKVIGEADGDFADIGSGSGEHATAAGTTIGTSGYMSPEQVRGAADIDGRTDVYALGCVLFEILAGQMLHPKGNMGLASAVAGIDAQPSKRAPDREIPPELDDICVQACAKDREDRIATARELGDRVQRYLDGDRDLATRKKLAAEHLARAQAAFAADTDDQRRAAMRQAASALALDPSLAGAAELVGRLMLEPPRTTPAEVEAEMLEDDAQTVRATARTGIWIYGTFGAFTPLLWWIAPHLSPWVLATTALVLVNIGLCAWGARIRPEGREWLIVITNAVLVGIVARMFTPFLIAPALAAMSVMTMVYTPTTSWLAGPRGMVAVTGLAILGPWLLERAGWLSVTTTVDARGILMRAAGTAGAEGPTLAVAVVYTISLLAAAAVMANAIRARQRATKRHLHLQAWQLRQLVPTQGT